MKNILHKTIITLLLIIVFLFPTLTLANNEQKTDQMFKAEVIKIIEQRENTLPDGEIVEQQDLLLFGLESEYEGQEINFQGIDDFGIIKSNLYEIGDKVLVIASQNADGNVDFYITDYIRTNGIWWLSIFFILTIIIVGRWKGFRSLLSLVLTFFVIIKFIIPQIIAGSNPILITLIGSFAILLAIIYVTEGLNKKSHLAVTSILISLIITIVISWFFVELTKLSGLVGEDVFALINIGDATINFKGLLLAGIIIGALGVLDDVVVSQISTVEELIGANDKLTKKELFQKSYSVGISHISSMTNTLFLAYAGASLSVLIIFISGQSAFSSWSQIINNEQIATEIVRALTGSIGLILSVPISTILAVWWYKK